MSMQITLSTDSAVENWGKNAVLSFNNDGAVIHFSAKKDRTLMRSFYLGLYYLPIILNPFYWR